MRILLSNDPPYDRSRHYHESSPWKPSWIAHPAAPSSPNHSSPFFAEYKLEFSLATLQTVRIHLSADERYQFVVDGRPLSRGPERGDPNHWHFESFDLPLSSGPHTFLAKVWSLGTHRPYAQMSVRHGFLLFAEDPDLQPLLSTGLAPWTTAHIDAIAPIPVHIPGAFVATGCRFRISAAALNATRDYLPTQIIGPAVPASARMESPGQWLLTPATLPSQHEEELTLGRIRHLDHTPPNPPDQSFATPFAPTTAPSDLDPWQDLLVGEAPVVVPPHSSRRVLIDLENYYCFYPHLITSGGAGSLIRLHSAEALFSADGKTKHHRDHTDNLHFLGQGDDYLPDGSSSQHFQPPWWLAGRYLQLSIQTHDHPLTLHALSFLETHYPFHWDTSLHTSDDRIQSFIPIALRSLEMCAHETYFDCPYYEQLMYVGDTRLEVLVTYAMTRDDRLPRAAITLFDQSRTPDGLTSARYPTKTAQTIPPFSFWFVAMVHDFMMWRGDKEFLRGRMPGVRAVIEALRARVDDDGHFHPFQGWNFSDWAGHLPGQPHSQQPSQPPFFGPGPSAIHQFHAAYTLNLAAELETHLGEDTLAARHLILTRKLRSTAHRTYFNHDRSLYRELPLQSPLPPNWSEYTEQTQSLALLSGSVPAGVLPRFAAAFIAAENLLPATIYFSFYLFEAYRLLAPFGGIDAFYKRLSLWNSLADRGFKTTFEMPEPTRSDCHAWGAHPLFHLYATTLGVRPAAPAFAKVQVQPHLSPHGPHHVSGTLVHPAGNITLEASLQNNTTHATVKLPPGIPGTLTLNGTQQTL